MSRQILGINLMKAAWFYFVRFSDSGTYYAPAKEITNHTWTTSGTYLSFHTRKCLVFTRMLTSLKIRRKLKRLAFITSRTRTLKVCALYDDVFFEGYCLIRGREPGRGNITSFFKGFGMLSRW